MHYKVGKTEERKRRGENRSAISYRYRFPTVVRSVGSCIVLGNIRTFAVLSFQHTFPTVIRAVASVQCFGTPDKRGDISSCPGFPRCFVDSCSGSTSRAPWKPWSTMISPQLSGTDLAQSVAQDTMDRDNRKSSLPRSVFGAVGSADYLGIRTAISPLDKFPTVLSYYVFLAAT
jgi:hypothetical protein